VSNFSALKFPLNGGLAGSEALCSHEQSFPIELPLLDLSPLLLPTVQMTRNSRSRLFTLFLLNHCLCGFVWIEVSSLCPVGVLIRFFPASINSIEAKGTGLTFFILHFLWE
jgi:hypothetical protein